MSGFIHLALIIILYSSIWFVPVSINYKRRKSGLAPYWLLFLLTLVMEIAIVSALVFLIGSIKNNVFLIYIPPVIASFAASIFYIYVAGKFDEKHS